MADRSEEARARAESKFKKKALQTQEANKVWAERDVAENASNQNAARLKSLRLAKEIADAAAPKTTGKARKKST